MMVVPPIRIGMLTGHISRNAAGVWEVIQNLSNSLALKGSVAPSVLGLEAPDTSTMLGRLANDNYEACKVSGPQSFGFAPSLLRAVEARDPDLLHNHGAWMYPSLVSYRWGKRTRRPVVISPHGMLDPWAVRRSRWKKFVVGVLFESRHFKTAQCFHATCVEEALSIRQFGIKKPVCVVPNGVQLPDIADQKKAAWVTELSGGRKVLLYLGRLHTKKGLEPFLRALALLKDNKHAEFESWVTVVAGQGESSYERYLRKLCEDCGLSDHVIFAGAKYDRDKQELFGSAEGFILPSLSEGLPVTVLEAWSHALPCVITPACHLTEGYKEGAAVRVLFGVEDIAHGLGILFDMSDRERRQMGLRGRRLVETHYSWDSVSQQMLSVYEWTLGGTFPAGVHVF